MTRIALDAGWELAASEPGAPFDPHRLTWYPAQVPGTAASALRNLDLWSFETPRNFDADDWWYRCHFSASTGRANSRTFLGCDGLATLAEVWLNDEPLLQSRDMFLAHAVDVTGVLRSQNELRIRFASLDAELARRRPRPRWKTQLVDNQQLRWIRTSLVGRMPAWSPPVAPVGPWRGVWIEERSAASVTVERLQARAQGERGHVTISARVEPYADVGSVRGELLVGDQSVEAHARQTGNREWRLEGELQMDNVERWWPHTHGGQPLYGAKLVVHVGDHVLTEDLGKVGFRTVEVDTREGGFGLRLNGEPLFARGACWTTTDVVTLTGTAHDYRQALLAARAAGMNMLRVGGTHFYEADTFYDICDELGILVWQDFMFANMDFPADDAQFVQDVRTEATQLLERLGRRPSLAMLCGGSEVEQQAAMYGLPRSAWANTLFTDLLPSVCQLHAPDVPYVRSTPTGAVLPFHVDQGIAHYYGVGAYLRPVEDARRANVRFAAECLAFANVPEDPTLDQITPGGQAIFHHPRWKERTPRDAGASWDFEDVRDHYVKSLFDVDAHELRRRDPERYLAISRVVTGELMAATFAEWRRAESTCRGGLVWFYRDHWPGAGWGVVDSTGAPKSAYYYLKRALAPVTAFFSDEGLNGLWMYAINEHECPLEATLTFRAWREGDVQVLGAETPVSIPGRGQVRLAVEGILDHFADTTYAYRFGPPSHQVAMLALTERFSGRQLATACHFPAGMSLPIERDLGLEAIVRADGAGHASIELRTRQFAQSVTIDVPGYLPDDNYLHLAPGARTLIRLTALEERRHVEGTVRALNGSETVRLAVARVEQSA